VSGTFGTIPLAAQTVLMNTVGLCFMVPLGLSIAATTRVGNLLGAGRAKRAQLVRRVVTWSGVVGSLVFVVVLAVARNQWGSVPAVCGVVLFAVALTLCCAVLCCSVSVTYFQTTLKWWIWWRKCCL
jgi:MATE family multidrug resistance protein